MYVDGFLLSVPKGKLAVYKKIATKAGKVWMDHGAVDYKECVGDDVNVKDMVHFPKVIGAKKDEVTIFSYIVFKSRAHRDKVNKAVMKDKRLTESMDMDNMPFDCKRMAYGGFKVLVDAKKK